MALGSSWATQLVRGSANLRLTSEVAMFAKRFFYFCAGLLFLIPSESTATRTREGFERLAQIKRVFVAPLGNDVGSDIVREKIRLELVRTGRLEVLERPDSADAIFMGAAVVE